MPVTREDVHGHVREDTHLDRLPRLPLGPRSFPKQKLLKEKFSSPAASSSMQKTSSAMLSSNDQDDILSKGPRSLKTNSDDASKIGLKRIKNSNAMQPNRIESGGKGKMIWLLMNHEHWHQQISAFIQCENLKNFCWSRLGNVKYDFF